MKKALAVCLLAGLFVACEQKSEPTVDEATSVALPMEVTYRGTPRIGSMKNVQTVMEWNKRVSALNVDVGDLLADTVSFHLADGMNMTAPRDSAIAFLKMFVTQVSKIELTYTAAVPVNMVERKDEWVFSWTDETHTMKDGTADHAYYHEDYRLVNGKIREVFQYARKIATDALVSN